MWSKALRGDQPVVAERRDHQTRHPVAEADRPGDPARGGQGRVFTVQHRRDHPRHHGQGVVGDVGLEVVGVHQRDATPGRRGVRIGGLGGAAHHAVEDHRRGWADIAVAVDLPAHARLGQVLRVGAPAGDVLRDNVGVSTTGPPASPSGSMVAPRVVPSRNGSTKPSAVGPIPAAIAGAIGADTTSRTWEKAEGPGPCGPGPSVLLYPNQALPESFSRRAASCASLASEPPADSAGPEEACELPLSEE